MWSAEKFEAAVAKHQKRSRAERVETRVRRKRVSNCARQARYRRRHREAFDAYQRECYRQRRGLGKLARALWHAGLMLADERPNPPRVTKEVADEAVWALLGVIHEKAKPVAAI